MADETPPPSEHPEIPYGIHCFGLTKERKHCVCPHWKAHTVGAECTLLKIVSEAGSGDNLVWNQVKECNINT